MLMENVKGLISHDKGRTLDVIVQTLGDIGYTVDFEVMNSKYFGVPQNRERIFIVAIRDDLVTPSPWEIGKRTDVVAKGKRRIAAIEGVKTFNFDWPEQNEVTVRLRDILERGVDEKFYLSEEKTAKLVRKLSEETRSKFENVDEIRLAQFCGDIGNRGISFSKDVSYTLRTVPHSDGGQHLQIPIEKCDSAIKQYEKFIDKNGYIPELFNPYNCTEIEEVAPTLTLMCDRVNASSTVLKLEPQMLGHIDLKGHDAIKRVYATEGVSPTLTPDRIEKRQNGRRFKEDDEESFTLTAQDRHGIAIGEKPRYRIRKLTPRECFRLQGFRDVDFDKLMANGISNSQLYKMAGNAVTVTVIDAIGKRLLPYLG
jgi:DNA (cytosine-5)-methyltransferase 1